MFDVRPAFNAPAEAAARLSQWKPFRSSDGASLHGELRSSAEFSEVSAGTANELKARAELPWLACHYVASLYILPRTWLQ